MEYYWWMSYIVGGVLLAWFTLMVWKQKLTMEGFKELVEAVNTRGGNIIVLLIMSAVFFSAAIRMFYWTVNKMADGKLTPDNAMVLAGWAFVTGMAFGGAFGSMLNTMTGNNPLKDKTATPLAPEPPKTTGN